MNISHILFLDFWRELDQKQYYLYNAKQVDIIREGKRMDKKVIVYSTATCPYCTMTKNFLKEKNVLYENIDVGQDRDKAMEMVQKSGQMGVPVLDIGGEIIIGFDKPAIIKALGLQNV